eukprot:TRINITY_DN3338_c0_g1_i2.p1 TRINITY_DN3338_c0_g1~~TRINITY_DN3338_c0_g1_i2.p1  ORF type:complete len:448 (-),score=135.80 TRINITY_DN3338_c0_g1_i2:52-1395(-)
MKIHMPVFSGIVRWLSDADPFKVLGVTRGATDAQIKEAFQNLARKHHPDANPDKKEESTKKFQEINNAYQTLTNPEKRQQFEAEEAMKRGGFGGGGGPFGGRRYGSPEDVFSSFFDGRSGRYGGGFGPNGPQAANIPLRGADVQTRVRISFMESMHGTTKELIVPGHTECLTCKGSGLKPGTSRKTCPLCKGSGQISSGSGFFHMVQSCPQCNGLGQANLSPCSTCKGEGFSETTNRIEIKVPMGVETGDELRVPGKGEPGLRGGPHGDLFVEVLVEPDPFFRRDDVNLHVSVDVSMCDALLGSKMDLPTPYGVVELTIPEGLQPGDSRRVPRKGVRRVSNRGGRVGDLFVHFRVVLPQKLNEEQKEKVRGLSALLRGTSYEDVGAKDSFLHNAKEKVLSFLHLHKDKKSSRKEEKKEDKKEEDVRKEKEKEKEREGDHSTEEESGE